MKCKFDKYTTITNSQIGDNNTYNNTYNSKSLSEDDWDKIEKAFDQLLNKMCNNPDLHRFFDNSKKYASNKDQKGLKDYFKKNCTEFIKNILYNVASTEIITLLAKKGIII